MSKRDVDRGAHCGPLAGGRDPCLAAAERFADGIRERIGEKGVAVLVFAVAADEGGLAITLNGRVAQCSAQSPAEFHAEITRPVDDLIEAAHKAARVRIVNGR